MTHPLTDSSSRTAPPDGPEKTERPDRRSRCNGSDQGAQMTESPGEETTVSTVPVAAAAASTPDPLPATREEALALIAEAIALPAPGFESVTVYAEGNWRHLAVRLPDECADGVEAWVAVLAADPVEVERELGEIQDDGVEQRAYHVVSARGRTSAAGWTFRVFTRVYVADVDLPSAPRELPGPRVGAPVEVLAVAVAR